MKEKEINVRIAKEDVPTWESFKHVVLEKHGKLHGVLGDEVMNAIRQYIESSPHIQSTHTHEEEQKPAPKKKKDVPMSPYHERLTAIQDRMREVGAWDVESFQDGIAVRYIKEVCGGDARTINKYYSDLQTKWMIEH